MAAVTKYTDYSVTTDFFIDFLQSEMNKRDIPGHFPNGRLAGVNVTGEHPYAQAIGTMIASEGQPNLGFLPAISVTEDDESEENTTVGQGTRPYDFMTVDMLNELKIKVGPMQERHKDGLITDGQIGLIESALHNSKEGNLILGVEEFFQKEAVYVSLWAHNIMELRILGNILRSVIYDMRKAMLKAGLFEITTHTSKGLMNYNFGKVIFGRETRIEYKQSIRNFTVYDDDTLPQEVYSQVTFKNTGDDKSVTMNGEGIDEE